MMGVLHIMDGQHLAILAWAASSYYEERKSRASFQTSHKDIRCSNLSGYLISIIREGVFCIRTGLMLG